MLVSKTVCHPGLVRDLNEDSYISNSDEGVWLVADGVGGNTGGEFASQLAVQVVERKLRQNLPFLEAIEEANESILSAVSNQTELEGMATTIIGVKILQNNFELAWVGDSRAYLIDPKKGIQRLSSDHNVAFELYEHGEISEAEMLSHQGQHELTQALGQESQLSIPVLNGRLGAGCFLMLCTDGLSGVVSEDFIFQTICGAKHLDQAAENLLSEVLEAGAPDNVTFTLIHHPQRLTNEDEESAAFKPDAPQEVRQVPFKNRAIMTWIVLLVVFVTLLLTFYLD